MIALAGWVGAALMCVAPFIIDSPTGKICAIAGLVLLTLQASQNKAYNLILLNVIGIGGYAYALYI